MNERATTLQKLREDPRVPVLILGGGINGIGLLRELALQRVKCLLVERADFASGASSKSSRMIHGGLRYLENREFALVRESLLERNRLLANAPHYVSPLKTTIPLFSRLGGLVRSALIFAGVSVRPGSRGSFITRCGLAYYDLVTRNDRRTPTHYLTGRKASLRSIPGLNPRIVATATYWDAAVTEAERLCIELIKDARQANPECGALNYVIPQRVDGGRVLLKDLPTGETLAVEPAVVVNATGAWVDFANAVLGVETHFMGGTKGSHLVVDCPELYRALGDQMVYYQHADGRVCIVFPFLDKVIMGSTDIPVKDPDEARCEEAEVDYMLETLHGILPGIKVGREHIVYSYCGVRPLPSSKSSVTANISRGHTLHTIEPGAGRPFPITCLIGGKWTTFRALAEQAADQVLARLALPRRARTAREPIGGGRNFPATREARAAWVRRVATASGLPDSRILDLLARYGTAAEEYACDATRFEETPLRSLPAYSIGEIARIAAGEDVVHLADIVYRRSTIGLLGHARPEVLAELAGIAGGVLGWSLDRQAEEVELARPPEVA